MPIMFLATNILEKLRRINVYAFDQVQLGIISKNDMKFNFAEQCLNAVLAKGILRFYCKFDILLLMKHDLKPPLLDQIEIGISLQKTLFNSNALCNILKPY